MITEIPCACSGCNFRLREMAKELVTEKEKVKRLIEYAVHTNRCILSFWEAGEPTENGGYRIKYKGIWYQSKPIDETPKCNCGLEEALKKTG